MSEECRKAFEAWIDPQGRNNYALERDGGGYKLMSTHSYWTAWQAAWNTRTPSVEGLVEALETIEKPRHGLDGTETESERAEYWARWALKYRDIARAALSHYRTGLKGN
jgi:hypothetical protein